MAMVRIAVMVIGTIAALIGLLWMGQGTGLVHWPAESFMIDMSEWTVRGAMLAAGGATLFVLARRTRTR
jgi:hypothetical protein